MQRIYNPFIFFVTLFLLNTSTLKAQTVNKITISVNEIAYDDPNFTALRETLKKNPKVKSVKPSFVAGVALLSFTYTGEASQLWEEIPKPSKRFFSLGELDDDAITLTYLNPQKKQGNTTAGTDASTPRAAGKTGCFDCEYFPMCTYDLKKSYGGKVYRGIRGNNESINYYYCENGEVTRRWITSYTPTDRTVAYDPISNIELTVYTEGNEKFTSHSEIVLKSNEPVGAKWGSENGDHFYKILEKGVAVTANGIQYKNAIAVQNIDDVYYFAKGAGLVKIVSMKDYMPEGIIDHEIAGVWNIVDTTDKSIRHYWKFNDDGTGAYGYDESFNNYNSFASNTFKWRILKNNVFYMVMDGESYHHFEHAVKKLLPQISINGKVFNRHVPDDSLYAKVDIPASYQDGMGKLVAAIERNINSSELEKKNLKETNDVIIRFTVTKTGVIKDFAPITNLNGLENEVIRILKIYKDQWRPALKNDGTIVNSVYEFHQVIKIPYFKYIKQ